MIQVFEHGKFEENLDSIFRIRLDEENEIELKLIEVSPLTRTTRQELFSIEFLSAANTILQQRIYRLESEKLGPLDLFLVPIRQDSQGVYYQAVFNRVIDQAGSAAPGS
jgi:hypothetical protein